MGRRLGIVKTLILLVGATFFSYLIFTLVFSFFINLFPIAGSIVRYPFMMVMSFAIVYKYFYAYLKKKDRRKR
jgi:xanthine/uracil permease